MAFEYFKINCTKQLTAGPLQALTTNLAEPPCQAAFRSGREPSAPGERLCQTGRNLGSHHGASSQGGTDSWHPSSTKPNSSMRVVLSNDLAYSSHAIVSFGRWERVAQ